MNRKEIDILIKNLVAEVRDCSTQQGIDIRIERAMEKLAVKYEAEIQSIKNETSLNANRGIMAGWLCGICGMVMSPFQSTCCNSPHQKLVSNTSTGMKEYD